ncbi:MAG: hypothetical protein ACRDLT_14995 [Solirubrobacteraceae bacterium]
MRLEVRQGEDGGDDVDGFSSWSVDLGTDVLSCSPELFWMHGADGTDVQVVQPAFETWLELLPEPDHQALAALRARVVSTGQGAQIEYRVRDGRSIRWLSTVMTSPSAAVTR